MNNIFNANNQRTSDEEEEEEEQRGPVRRQSRWQAARIAMRRTMLRRRQLWEEDSSQRAQPSKLFSGLSAPYYYCPTPRGTFHSFSFQFQFPSRLQQHFPLPQPPRLSITPFSGGREWRHIFVAKTVPSSGNEILLIVSSLALAICNEGVLKKSNSNLYGGI